MASPDDSRRWAAGHIAQKEARRRALEVSKVGLIVVVTILATLVLSGHRAGPDALRSIISIERGNALK